MPSDHRRPLDSAIDAAARALTAHEPPFSLRESVSARIRRPHGWWGKPLGQAGLAAAAVMVAAVAIWMAATWVAPPGDDGRQSSAALASRTLPMWTAAVPTVAAAMTVPAATPGGPAAARSTVVFANPDGRAMTPPIEVQGADVEPLAIDAIPVAPLDVPAVFVANASVAPLEIEPLTVDPLF